MRFLFVRSLTKTSMATATIVRFPAFSFRKLPTPYDEEGKHKYHAILEVQDVPQEFDEWRALNVRDPKENTHAPKEIKDTLENTPDTFLFKNRGLLVLADRVTYDNKTGEVQVEFTSKEMNGLADGGHSFRAIRNHVEPLTAEEREQVGALVTVEFLEGFKTREEVVPIIEARNTSTPVKEQSIQELLGNYNKIKEAIKDKPYAARVYYKQYEEATDGVEKDIDIKEILSYLYCFDVESFDDKTHPLKAYVSTAAVVKHFAQKDNIERLAKYIPLLTDILELHDRIYERLPEVWKGHFGALKGVKKLSESTEELYFTDKFSNYRIPKGFIYPILASLRNLVKVEGDAVSWKDEPFEFFARVEDELVSYVCTQALALKNPNALGKDSAAWVMCYKEVENIVLKRHI